MGWSIKKPLGGRRSVARHFVKTFNPVALAKEAIRPLIAAGDAKAQEEANREAQEAILEQQEAERMEREESGRKSALERIFEEAQGQFLAALKPEEAETRESAIAQLRERGLLSSPLAASIFTEAERQNLARRSGIIGQISQQKAAAELNRQIRAEEFQRNLLLQRQQLEAQKQAAREERKRRRRGGVGELLGGLGGAALGNMLLPGLGAVVGGGIGGSLGDILS